MSSLVRILGLLGLLLTCGCGRNQNSNIPSTYTIAPSASMADTLRFDKPVDLAAKPASLEHFSDQQPPFGAPLAAWSFQDHTSSAYSYSIIVYPKGKAFGEHREKVIQFAREFQKLAKKSAPSNSRPDGELIHDGRTINLGPLGFGAGGESNFMLVPHRTEPIEILLMESVSYLDPPLDGSPRPNAKPTINYWDVIDQIEAMITAIR